MNMDQSTIKFTPKIHIRLRKREKKNNLFMRFQANRDKIQKKIVKQALQKIKNPRRSQGHSLSLI